MLNSRVGSLVGARATSAVGSSVDDEGNSGAGPVITRDPTSNIYVPANAAEWAAFISLFGLSVAVPDSVWNCQESSGNLADSVGSLTLVANGTVSYSQAVAGWSRVGVKTTDGSNGGFTAGAGVGPNPNTTSQTWLTIAALPATPAAQRIVHGLRIETTLGARSMHQATGVMRNIWISTNTTGAVSMSNTVQPCVLTHNITGATGLSYNSQEKITTGSWALIADGDKGIGNKAGGNLPGNITYIYTAMWSGSNGEISSANLKTMLQAMGFSIAWS